MPAGNKFLRIRGNSNKCITANTETNVATLSNASNATTIFYLTSDKKLISYSNGLGLYWTHAFAAPENASLHNTFTFSEGGSTGKYTIQSNATTVHGRTVDEYLSDAGESSLGRAASVSSPSTDWTLTEITALPVTISDVKYATLYSPVALTIPSGVKAYYVSALTSTEATLTEISTTIPANTGVILYANVDVATTYNFDITTGGTDVSSSNKLSGVIATTAFDDNVAYTLQQQNGGTAVGLFPKTAGNLAGFKAYMLASQLSAGVKGLVFSFEDADGISQIENGELKIENAIYNIAGQRVTKPTKGLYIKNGKKVIIK